VAIWVLMSSVGIMMHTGCGMDGDGGDGEGTDCVAAATGKLEGDTTKDVGDDIVGVWEGYGIDSRIIYEFTASTWRLIEPPNYYAPSGLTSSGTWSISGDMLTFTQDESSFSQKFSVTNNTLLLGINSFTRSVCKGYGFN
jgi:hypothetical protein